MRTFRSFAIFFAAAIAGSFAFAGCKSSVTAPGGGGSSTITAPGVGSYFMTVETIIDSTGTVTSNDTIKQVILQTGVSIYGETGVSVELDSDAQGWSPDTNYLVYESNGDLSTYQSNNAQVWSGSLAGWWTVPFSSQKTTTLTSFISGSDWEDIDTMTYTGAGTGQLELNGQTISIENVSERYVNYAGSTSNGKTSFSIGGNNGMESFAPTLGWWTKHNYFDTIPRQSIDRVLISYSLK